MIFDRTEENRTEEKLDRMALLSTTDTLVGPRGGRGFNSENFTNWILKIDFYISVRGGCRYSKPGPLLRQPVTVGQGLRQAQRSQVLR